MNRLAFDRYNPLDLIEELSKVLQNEELYDVAKQARNLGSAIFIALERKRQSSFVVNGVNNSMKSFDLKKLANTLEKISSKKKEEELEPEVLKFLSDNPNPNDATVHGWAEKNKLEVDDVEEAIYRLATKFADIALGGFSKGKEPKDLDPKQVEMGIKVEKEHTKDEGLARKITYDHLAEFPSYYTALKEMEDKLKNERKE